jgi:F-type H+-transporting ATPase subunit b
MKRNGHISILMGVFLLLFFISAGALASETEGNAAGERATEIFKWINFTIVAGVIIWIFAKALPPVFKKNAQTINFEIAKAKAAQDAANRQLMDAEARLANVKREIEELTAAALRESAAEGSRIAATTRSDIQKIEVGAKAEMEAAERAARLELKALMSKLAVGGAEKIIAEQLTAQSQETLIDNFLKTLEGRPN